MMTERDIKRLRRSSSRRYRVGVIVAVTLLMLTFSVCGALNLIIAHRYAQESGTSLAGLFRDDTAGFDIDRTYPGTYVRALDRYTGGLLELMLVPYFLLQGITSWFLMNRNVRILKTLERQQATEHTAGDGSTGA
jgi:hypothetical protein